MLQLKSIAVGVVLLASAAGASSVERASFSTKATCSCKGPGDCTCPKGKCKCKNCGANMKLKVFGTLKGNTETTRLPTTARYDARGGIFI